MDEGKRNRKFARNDFPEGAAYLESDMGGEDKKGGQLAAKRMEIVIKKKRNWHPDQENPLDNKPNEQKMERHSREATRHPGTSDRRRAREDVDEDDISIERADRRERLELKKPKVGSKSRMARDDDEADRRSGHRDSSKSEGRRKPESTASRKAASEHDNEPSMADDDLEKKSESRILQRKTSETGSRRYGADRDSDVNRSNEHRKKPERKSEQDGAETRQKERSQVSRKQNDPDTQDDLKNRGKKDDQFKKNTGEDLPRKSEHTKKQADLIADEDRQNPRDRKDSDRRKDKADEDSRHRRDSRYRETFSDSRQDRDYRAHRKSDRKEDDRRQSQREKSGIAGGELQEQDRVKHERGSKDFKKSEGNSVPSTDIKSRDSYKDSAREELAAEESTGKQEPEDEKESVREGRKDRGGAEDENLSSRVKKGGVAAEEASIRAKQASKRDLEVAEGAGDVASSGRGRRDRGRDVMAEKSPEREDASARQRGKASDRGRAEESRREGRDSREGRREGREKREGREGRERREGRDDREGREGREGRDRREGRERREVRDSRDGREGREGSERDGREGKDSKEARDGREDRGGKEGREERDVRERNKDGREARERLREPGRDAWDGREGRRGDWGGSGGMWDGRGRDYPGGGQGPEGSWPEMERNEFGFPGAEFGRGSGFGGFRGRGRAGFFPDGGRGGWRGPMPPMSMPMHMPGMPPAMFPMGMPPPMPPLMPPHMPGAMEAGFPPGPGLGFRGPGFMGEEWEEAEKQGLEVGPGHEAEGDDEEREADWDGAEEGQGEVDSKQMAAKVVRGRLEEVCQEHMERILACLPPSLELKQTAGAAEEVKEQGMEEDSTVSRIHAALRWVNDKVAEPLDKQEEAYQEEEGKSVGEIVGWKWAVQSTIGVFSLPFDPLSLDQKAAIKAEEGGKEPPHSAPVSDMALAAPEGVKQEQHEDLERQEHVLALAEGLESEGEGEEEASETLFDSLGSMQETGDNEL